MRRVDQDRALDIAHATGLRQMRDHGQAELAATLGNRVDLANAAKPPPIKRRKREHSPLQPDQHAVERSSAESFSGKRVRVSNQMDGLPEARSLQQVALSDSRKAFMECLLREDETGVDNADAQELYLIGALPPNTTDAPLLEKLGTQFQSHQHTLNRVVVDREQRLPETALVTREYLQMMLVEPLQDRSRPCVNGDACITKRHYGWVMREMPPPREHRAWLALRKDDPTSAIQQLTHNYRCAICDLTSFNAMHFKRTQEQNDHDPHVMPTGTVKDINDRWRILNHWKVLAGVPGEFDPWHCLGANDQYFVGLDGFVPILRLGQWKEDQRTLDTDAGRVQQRFIHIPSEVLFGDGVGLGVTQDGIPSSRSTPVGSA